MIHHVVPTLDKELGGVDVAARELCDGLHSQRENLLVHTLRRPMNPVKFQIQDYRLGRGSPMRLGWSPAMKAGLKASIQNGDVIHNHSLWMMPNIYAGQVAKQAGGILINTPHGTLSEWALQRSSWKKHLSLFLGQRRALANTDCFHVTGRAELEALRSLGYLQPVAMVPNGVCFPSGQERKGSSEGDFTVLFLARLHPVKGLDNLLRAWARIEEKHKDDIRLIVAGPDENGYGIKMQALASRLGLKGVSFVGAVVGEKKSALYESADIYVLPTHSENFGLTVAEALAHRTPVITTKGAPWEGVTKHQCGWWIDHGVEALFEALDKGIQTKRATLLAMGNQGHDWMAKEFSWSSVALQMQCVYRWLEGAGSRPDFVEL